MKPNNNNEPRSYNSNESHTSVVSTDIGDVHLTALHQRRFGEAIELITQFYGCSAQVAEDIVESLIEQGDLNEDTNGKFPILRMPSQGSEKKNTDTPSDTPSSEQVSRAITDAIEFFHAQLDSEYDCGEHKTPRDYFENGRGWTRETVNQNKLGFAPPDSLDLLHHLMEEYDGETIRATGLFWDNLEPIWKGRYVFPYFDESGRPVFAISRRVGEGHSADDTGNYREDSSPSKYHKIPTNTIDDCMLEEPVYGIESIIPNTPVVITEGIADAISIQEAGYPCISPVTTRFDQDSEDRVVRLLDEYDIDTVYIIQDSERPSSEVDHENNLVIKQLGDGSIGAIRTAIRLSEEGKNVLVGDLPRCGLNKVDLDDYITEWDGNIDAILRSAKPPQQHPAYDIVCPTGEQEHTSTTQENTSSRATSGQSGLWSISISSVSSLGPGYRGQNPLGHHGESEDYFTVVEAGGDVFAYDHKYKTSYNALTYILCEAGERHPSAPGGSLSDEEIWVAWKFAKKQGYIPKDDPCPVRALKHIALERGICSSSDIVAGWKLPDGAYKETLRVIRQDHDIKPGRTYAELTSTLPTEQLHNLDWNDAKQLAKTYGFGWPSTSEARDRLEIQLRDTISVASDEIIDAPTALGKSHTAATVPWLDHPSVTDGEPVLHFHATKKARDEADNASMKAGLRSKKIRSREEICPVCAGEHDQAITMNGIPASEWIDKQCDDKGIPLSTVHYNLAQNNDQGVELPCQPNEEAECPSKTQWDDVPRDSSDSKRGGCAGPVGHGSSSTESVKYDIVHATHNMLFVPSVSDSTNIIIDELPDFSEDVSEKGMSMTRIQNAVNALLDEIDAPVTTWEDFITLLSHRYDDTYDPLGGQVALSTGKFKQALEDVSVSFDWYLSEPDAHVLAPAIIECIIDAFAKGGPDQNGLQVGTAIHSLPRVDVQTKIRVSLVIDETNRIRYIRSVPDLEDTRCIVGLDAHPAMPLWELNTLGSIDQTPVLDADERRLWRLFERGLFTVQVGKATRPLSGNKAQEWFDEERLDILISELVEDDLQTAITTAQVEDDLKRLLRLNGAPRPDTMHYGEVRSRNDFKNEDVGLVNGCMDPGDQYVLGILAEYGADAQPETTTDEEGEERRARGRGFVGDDAEIAEDILASVRENQVAQAAGRYARNPEDPDDRAIVYVRTDAIPQDLSDLQVSGVEWIATESQRTIIESLQNGPLKTAKEIADETGVTKRHVLKTLNKLQEDNVVHRREGAGEYGADLFSLLTGSTTTHLSGLGGEITNGEVLDSSTWLFVILNSDDQVSDGWEEYDEFDDPDPLDTPSNAVDTPISSPSPDQSHSSSSLDESDLAWEV